MSNKVVFLALLLPSILLAAMSDSAAMFEAKKRFGPMANIAQVRGPFDTYWTKQVGVNSKGCDKEFTVLGQGLNTWEAAFAAVPASAVAGPYSGQVELKSIAWDNVGVAGVQWLIDGAPLGPEIRKEVAPTMLNISLLWDTASGPPGVHVLCLRARDAAGNVGRSRAIAVNLDPSKPSISAVIDLMNATGEPSVQR